MRETKEALRWIVSILRKNKIPFEITGGLASRIYGSKRLLADIDIEVPDKYLTKIQQLTKKYIIYGPREYKDKNFDLPLMTLKYKGQKIDISGKDSEKIFDKKKRKWVKEKVDLSKSEIKKVDDLIVPVIPLKELISYKKELGRDVDKRDVKDLSKKKKNNLKIMASFLFILGIFFIINFKLQITGAFIGSFNAPSIFNLIFGLIFILISVIVFASKKDLENLSKESEEERMNQQPVILDTNYLIKACRNESDYIKLMNFLKTRNTYDRLIIVPKGVTSELKKDQCNKLDLKKMENLKEVLTKYGTTIEDRRGEYLEEYKKHKDVNAAKEILQKTPKYLAYSYLSQVNNGGDADIDKFLRRTRNVSSAFSEQEYKSELGKANSLYRKAKNPSEIRKLISGYNISDTDLDILSTGIYLVEVPDVFFDRPLDNVSIISEDSHLIDSSRIFDRINPSKRGKIRVLKELPKN